VYLTQVQVSTGVCIDIYNCSVAIHKSTDNSNHAVVSCPGVSRPLIQERVNTSQKEQCHRYAQPSSVVEFELYRPPPTDINNQPRRTVTYLVIVIRGFLAYTVTCYLSDFSCAILTTYSVTSFSNTSTFYTTASSITL
jgi:hypothetical protein